MLLLTLFREQNQELRQQQEKAQAAREAELHALETQQRRHQDLFIQVQQWTSAASSLPPLSPSQALLSPSQPQDLLADDPP